MFRLTHRAVVAALSAVMLLVAAPAARAERPTGSPPEEGAKPKRLAAPKRRPAAAAQAMRDAARVSPIVPESLARALPRALGNFARTSIEANAEQVMQALWTKADAHYTDTRGRSMHVLLADTAGLAPETATVVAPLAKGQRAEADGIVREGHEVLGFAAVSEDGGPKGTSRVQVVVAPRLRLTLTADAVPASELLTLAEGVDLKTLAQALPAAH